MGALDSKIASASMDISWYSFARDELVLVSTCNCWDLVLLLGERERNRADNGVFKLLEAEEGSVRPSVLVLVLLSEVNIMVEAGDMVFMPSFLFMRLRFN
jgi:hypothetical protein